VNEGRACFNFSTKSVLYMDQVCIFRQKQVRVIVIQDHQIVRSRESLTYVCLQIIRFFINFIVKQEYQFF